MTTIHQPWTLFLGERVVQLFGTICHLEMSRMFKFRAQAADFFLFIFLFPYDFCFVSQHQDELNQSSLLEKHS